MYIAEIFNNDIPYRFNTDNTLVAYGNINNNAFYNVDDLQYYINNNKAEIEKFKKEQDLTEVRVYIIKIKLEDTDIKIII